MLHTNVKHEPSTYTEAITERGAQCTRYGFAQKKRNLLQETAVGIIFTMGPKKTFFEVCTRIFILLLSRFLLGKIVGFENTLRTEMFALGCLFMR